MTSLEAAKMLIGKVLETGHERVEWVLNHPETGEAIPFDSTIARIKYKDQYMVMSYGLDVRERNAAIKKLREADEKTKIMFDAMPLCSNLWNRSGTITDCNDEVVKLLELKDKQEYINRFVELNPKYQPDGSPSAETAALLVAKAFEEGYCQFEWMMQKLSGELMPTEVTLVRIKYQDDYMVVAYFSDLRERNAAIAKMREADERAHIMFDTAPFASFMFDKDYNVLDCNQEIVKLFEIPGKEFYFKNFSDLSPEYQPCGTLSSIKAAEDNRIALEKGYHHFEWMCRKQNGDLVPTEVTLLRVNYRGEYAIAGYIRDLTEKKAAEQLTKEVMEKTSTLTAIFNSTTDMIFCKNKNLYYTECNKAMENYFNIRNSDIIGKHEANTLNIPPEIAEQLIAVDKKVLAGKKAITTEEIIRSFDGRMSHFELIRSPLIQEGEIVGLVGMARDITQRKLMEEETKKAYAEAMKAYAEAENASEAKSRFIANMNHEMRTPMNVIVGLTDLLLEDDVPGKIRETLEKINTAGNILMGLITDVLDISKVEAGKLELISVQYEVASLLNDVITLNVIRSEEKPITFRLDINEDLPCSLLGDDMRVKQILNNLLNNAFKYTKEGTVTLGVNCQREKDNVWMSFYISDTGIGIRAEDITKLFTDYNQVDTSANRQIEGTGLGLSIAKNFVELMDGEISVESVYGKGSTFRARIRQGYDNEKFLGKETVDNLRSFHYSEKKKSRHEKLVRSDLSYARVLVVDDLATNLDVAAGMLRKYKLHVDCVTSGNEAIDLISASTPVYNAIFMDHMMPGMDGIQATQAIRKLNTEYAKTVPIIALTANAVAGNERMFLNNGFNAYLPKPFNVMSLDSIIQRWVRDKAKE
jgi:PAS domain S-box-containing protein